MPDAAIRKPKPAASLGQVFLRKRRQQHVQFMPTVATTPTTVTASSTTGVRRT